MGDAIKHCMANLANFDGRDSRATFWWWVLCVVVVTVLLSMVSGLVFAASSMGDAFQSAAAGVDEAQIEAEMMQGMAGSLGTQAWIGAGISLLGIALLIASFVRRLRDAGLPVLIAAIPVATVLYSSWNSVSVASQAADIMASGDVQAVNEFALATAGAGMVGWIGYIVVIVGGLLPTKA